MTSERRISIQGWLAPLAVGACLALVAAMTLAAFVRVGSDAGSATGTDDTGPILTERSDNAALPLVFPSTEVSGGDSRPNPTNGLVAAAVATVDAVPPADPGAPGDGVTVLPPGNEDPGNPGDPPRDDPPDGGGGDNGGDNGNGGGSSDNDNDGGVIGPGAPDGGGGSDDEPDLADRGNNGKGKGGKGNGNNGSSNNPGKGGQNGNGNNPGKGGQNGPSGKPNGNKPPSGDEGSDDPAEPGASAGGTKQDDAPEDESSSGKGQSCDPGNGNGSGNGSSNAASQGNGSGQSNSNGNGGGNGNGNKP